MRNISFWFRKLGCYNFSRMDPEFAVVSSTCISACVTDKKPCRKECLFTHNHCFSQKTMWVFWFFFFFPSGEAKDELKFQCQHDLVESSEISLANNFPFVIGVRSRCHCSIGKIHRELLFTLVRSFHSLKAKETNWKWYGC